MKKILSYYVLPIAVLVVFILIMNSGNYLKAPRRASDDFAADLHRVQQQVKSSQWEYARETYPLLTAAWHEIIPRIQYSVEKDEINAINVNLARLQVFIDVHDKNSALAEINEVREHWTHLNN